MLDSHSKSLITRQNKIMDMFEKWRPLSKIAYDYLYSHSFKWPASCGKWGDVVAENDSMIRQEIVFGCKTDGVYNKSSHYWDGVSSLVILGEVDIPKSGYSIPHRLDSTTFGSKDMKRRITIK